MSRRIEILLSSKDLSPFQVYRGGGCNNDPEVFVRVKRRCADAPHDRDKDLGFRLIVSEMTWLGK